LVGGFLEPRPDFADASFFFAGFFAAILDFEGFAGRDFCVPDFGAARLRAGVERDFGLRPAPALDLGRDFFTGFGAFLAMVVLRWARLWASALL